MTRPRFDILGIGNAIVDVVAPVPDSFLSKHDMRKGSMALISAETADALSRAMPEGQQSSGGSVANSCAVAAGLGARVAYLGRVADDAAGAAFRTDIGAAGVHFPSTPGTGGAPTARSFILVTADGQRTMNTYLGACVDFEAGDVDEAVVADSAITYLEGYLFDPPPAQAAFNKAAAAARAAGRQVALSLSDAFCVDRHRAAFRELLHRVDILFANEVEICSLFEMDDFEQATEALRGRVDIAAITRGAEGSVVLRGGETTLVPAAPAQVVDTTGAGDAYAAGFLAGLTGGRSMAECGQLGSIAAAEIIGHYGARPQADLRQLAGTLVG